MLTPKPRIRVAMRKVSEMAVLLHDSRGWTRGMSPIPRWSKDQTHWELYQRNLRGEISVKPVVLIEDIPLVGNYGNFHFDLRLPHQLP